MSEDLLALAVGVLFAAGAYLILQRSLGHIIIGLALFSHATNLLVFVAGGVTRGGVPLLAAGQDAPPPDFADPVPQAFILTALVIGFGVLAFFIALATRAFHLSGSHDPEVLSTTDRITRLEPER